ncbi:hypothetical protein, partial [Corallococcus sp. RDP092CA]|uniref:hypothetical protein n=1 Tax=Corallococcus sp. RDP092CA TaxID=3109369 RepID=UPI0035B1FB80
YLETSSIPATSSVTLSRQTTRQWELRNAPENRTKFLCPTREYDALGRLWKQSFPYADREAPAFTIFTYDKAGRLSQQEA